MRANSNSARSTHHRPRPYSRTTIHAMTLAQNLRKMPRPWNLPGDNDDKTQPQLANPMLAWLHFRDPGKSKEIEAALMAKFSDMPIFAEPDA